MDLTHERILATPVGPELEALVAERVMGFLWERLPNRSGSTDRYLHTSGGEIAADWTEEDGLDAVKGVLPPYSTDITAAWEVLAVVREWRFSRRNRFTGELRNLISQRVGISEGAVMAHEEVILYVEPVDVCRAALLAVLDG